jgi:hypothetical protein
LEHFSAILEVLWKLPDRVYKKRQLGRPNHHFSHPWEPPFWCISCSLTAKIILSILTTRATKTTVQILCRYIIDSTTHSKKKQHSVMLMDEQAFCYLISHHSEPLADPNLDSFGVNLVEYHLQYIDFEHREIEYDYSSLAMIVWQDKDCDSGKSGISQNLEKSGDMGTKQFQLKFGTDLDTYDRLFYKKSQSNWAKTERLSLLVGKVVPWEK